jgi:hypothetical protein
VSTMYFAKLNFNSEIYDVYENGALLTDFLNKVFTGLTEKVTFDDDKGRRFKFITLIKDEKGSWISGRLVLIAPGTVISYDPEKDDVIESYNKNGASYVTFYFDISKESIAFVPKRTFGHVMFIEMFKKLIELCVIDANVEIFLEKNIHMLREKIYKFKSVQTIEIDIVPPNGDKEDFEALFGTKADEIKETKATKFKINLAAPIKIGIDVKAKYIDRLIKAVSKGFGEMVVKGKNQANADQTLKSDKDAPYTMPIADMNKDNLVEFPIYARAGISELMEHRIAIEVASANEE